MSLVLGMSVSSTNLHKTEQLRVQLFPLTFCTPLLTPYLFTFLLLVAPVFATHLVPVRFHHLFSLAINSPLFG